MGWKIVKAISDVSWLYTVLKSLVVVVPLIVGVLCRAGVRKIPQDQSPPSQPPETHPCFPISFIFANHQNMGYPLKPRNADFDMFRTHWWMKHDTCSLQHD